MSEEWNPYTAPPSATESASIELTKSIVTARAIFLTWEKRLRPSYNLILAGVAGLIVLNFTNMGYPVPLNGRTIFHFMS